MYLRLVQLCHQLGETGMDLFEAVVDSLTGYPLLTGYVRAELHLTVDGVDQVDLLRGELVHGEEQLADAVFKSLGFHQVDQSILVEYLRSPKLMGLARQEAQRTLRFIIAYRLLRDLRRGWRFNNPNLDQLGLLAIRYRGLDEFCANASSFAVPIWLMVPTRF